VLDFAIGQKVTAAEVKARHRELARRHHPDRGGSVARMQEINAAVDQLLATL
jgi:curved DNA-binding protein CbpA